MAKVTKTMLEEDNKYLGKRLHEAKEKLSLAEQRVKELEEIIKTYRGMNSLTLAAESVTNALAQTVSTLERREEREARRNVRRD